MVEDFESHMPKHKKDDLNLCSAGMVKKSISKNNPNKVWVNLGEWWWAMDDGWYILKGDGCVMNGDGYWSYIFKYIYYIFILYINIFLIYMRIYIYIYYNIGTPKSSINCTRGFHYKPSILGYPYFWKHPYISPKWCQVLGLKNSLVID